MQAADRIATRYLRRYPFIEIGAASLRAERGRKLPDWPAWCYLPVAGVHALLAQRLSPEMFLGDIGPLAAVLAWRRSRCVFRFAPEDHPSPEVLDALAPGRDFLNFPAFAAWIEPPPNWTRAQLRGGGAFLAHLEYDPESGQAELRFAFPSPSGFGAIEFEILCVYLGYWDLSAALEAVLHENRRTARELLTPGQGEVSGDGGFEPERLTTVMMALLSDASLASGAACLASFIAPYVYLVHRLCTARTFRPLTPGAVAPPGFTEANESGAFLTEWVPGPS